MKQLELKSRVGQIAVHVYTTPTCHFFRLPVDIIYMNMKIHQTESGEVIAICDAELIGNTYENEKACITITPDFFGTEQVPEDKVEKALREGDNITMAGTRTIALAREIGILGEEDIILIQGVPYATIFRW